MKRPFAVWARPGRRARLPLALWLVLAIVLAAVVGTFVVTLAVKSPFKGYRADSVLVRIPPRSSTLSILEALERGGVIRDRRLGLVSLKVFHRGRTLKAGEYRFVGPRSAEQVILSIASGDVVTYRLTVPEGFTAEEIAAIFASQGFGTEHDYQRLVKSPGEFEGVPKEAPSLEGFLFPDTYTVTRSMTAREIVTLMTREFTRRTAADGGPRLVKSGRSLLETVTLASLVEKETALAEERPLVAAVYRNRLARGMLLQCDPTTIYALKRRGLWHGTLTRSDLAIEEPYNTYVVPGLPPGPICSPGLASLRAAAAPADVKYLYFVAAGDGSHRFSTDYEEQQRNVAQYRQARQAARDAP